MKPVIIFILDCQMSVCKLEKRQILCLPEIQKLPEAVSRSVRIHSSVLGNVITISVLTANNMRFKNKYKIGSCLEMF